MKRIITILIMLAVVSGALAVNPLLQVIVRKNAGGEIVLADYSGTQTGEISVFDAGFPYSSGRLQATANGSVSRVSLMLRANNSPTGTMFLQIWVHGSGDPDSMIEQSSTTLDLTTVGATYSTYEFEFSSTTFTSGTNYHIVLFCATTDGSNFIYWMETAASGSAQYRDDDASSWTFRGDDQHWVMVYGQ